MDRVLSFSKKKDLSFPASGVAEARTAKLSDSERNDFCRRNLPLLLQVATTDFSANSSTRLTITCSPNSHIVALKSAGIDWLSSSLVEMKNDDMSG